MSFSGVRPFARLSSCSLCLIAVFAGIFCAAEVRAQNIVVDTPAALPVGGTVDVGSANANSSGTSSLGFHFTQDVVITAVTYDPGPGGVQELAVESFGGPGCVYNTTVNAGTECSVETGIFPLYPGWRYGTLRVVTTGQTYVVPVAYSASLAEAGFLPAVLTGVPLGSGSTAGQAIAVDAQGNLYVADTTGNVVQKIDASGTATVVAGNGTTNNDGDGGPATAAGIGFPIEIAVSPAGDLYVTSASNVNDNETLRKVDGGTGIISTVAEFVNTTLPGTVFPRNSGTVVDRFGDIFFSLPFSKAITEQMPDGTQVSLLAGTGAPGTCPAATAFQPSTLALDGNGNLYFTSNFGVYKMSATAVACPAPVLVVGTGTSGNSGDGAAATAAEIGYASGLALDAAGDLYFADQTNNAVRVVNATTGTLATLAGGSSGLAVTVADGTGALALDAAANLNVLSADGTTDQKIALTSAALNFATTTTGSVSSDSPKALLLTNLGNSTLLFNNQAGTAPIAVTGAYSLDASSTCPLGSASTGQSLTPAASCVAAVDFKPTLVGANVGAVTFTDRNVTQYDTATPMTQTVPLNGTGTAQAATTTVNVSPTSINFGTVMQGNSSGTWTVNVANTGASPLTLAGVVLSDATDFVFGGNCGATVAAYSSCNVTLTFRPQVVGAVNATLTLTDNAGTGTQVVSLAGNSTSSAPVISFSPPAVNFGQVTVGSTSATWTINIANTGASTLNIYEIVPVDWTDFQFAANCSSIPAYGSCNVTVTFTPQSTGPFSSQLRVRSNATPEYQYVNLQGTGVAPAAPVVALSPSSINFGKVTVGNSSGTWTIYVGNTGASALNIGSIVLSDTTNFVLGGNCGATVAAYSSCEETIVFTPQSNGTFTGTLTFTDNASPATQTVALEGKAFGYKVSVTPAALSLKAGQSGTAAFTVVPGGGYTGSITFGCAGLPANASCSFAPATIVLDGSDKVMTAQLTVTTAGMNVAQVNGSGNSATLAGLLGVNALLVGCWTLRRKDAVRLRMLAMVALACLVLAGAVGCGSTISGVSTPMGVQAVQMTAVGTATGVATGTSPTSTQTANFTLTITQ